MKPAPFEYHAPDTLEAALLILKEHGSEAKVIAGGQSLVPAMNFRLFQPRMLVDLNGLPDLEYIRRSNGAGLRIGAMTRQRRLESDPLVAQLAPLMAEAVPYVAHAQIRNRGTLGGSLAHADPAAELPAVTLALGGRFKVRSWQGERLLEAEDFFLGMFTTALTEEEVLVEVELPPLPPDTGWSFMEFARRRGDYALMGIAARIGLDQEGKCKMARLIYLNAGDGPVEARLAAMQLQGQALDGDAVEAAAATAVEQEIDPPGNVHATPEYQRHLARVLTKRAVKLAAARAAQGMTIKSS